MTFFQAQQSCDIDVMICHFATTEQSDVLITNEKRKVRHCIAQVYVHAIEHILKEKQFFFSTVATSYQMNRFLYCGLLIAVIAFSSLPSSQACGEYINNCNTIVSAGEQ